MLSSFCGNLMDEQEDELAEALRGGSVTGEGKYVCVRGKGGEPRGLRGIKLAREHVWVGAHACNMQRCYIRTWQLTRQPSCRSAQGVP